MTTMTKTEQYKLNRKVKKHQENINAIKLEFDDQKIVDFERVRNARPEEIKNLQALLKRMLRISAREEVLISLGLVINEETKSAETADPMLLHALKSIPNAQQLKWDNDRPTQFHKAIVKAIPDVIAEFAPLVKTLEAFRHSIKMDGYMPKYAKAEEHNFGESKHEFLYGVPDVRGEYDDSDWSEYQPLPPKKKGQASKKGQVSKAGQDSKANFRAKFIDVFFVDLEESTEDDLDGERTKQIAKKFLKKAQAYDGIGRSEIIKRFSKKKPKEATAIIESLIRDGDREFM